jgi:hypothetical protein
LFFFVSFVVHMPMLKRLRNLVSPPSVPARGTSGVPPSLRNNPPSVEQRAALLAGKNIAYTLKRSSRRRSIGLRIDDRGLTVSVPLRASEKWLYSVLQDKAHWVVEKLDGWQMRKPVEIRWADGEMIHYLGEALTLRVVQGLFAATPVRRCGELSVFIANGHGSSAAPDDETRHARFPHPNPLNETTSHSTKPLKTAAKSLVIPQAGEGANVSLREFHVSDSGAAQIERAVAHWYQLEAERLFAERVAHYAALLDVAPRVVRLSSAKTQWGCCTARGTVRLNKQLVKLPLRLVDYVVVHELAHLREMNHSAAFWEVVGSVCPDYARLRRELKAVAL